VRRILYILFRRFYALHQRTGRRFTPAGRLMTAALAAAAVVGIDTNRTLAFQAFTLFLALLAIAAAFTPFFRGRFGVSRRLPRFGTAGSPLGYRIRVENRTGRTQRGLFLFEEMADPRPDYRLFLETPEPEEARRNRFDRYVRFYRWMWLISLKQPRFTSPGPTPLPDIPPGGAVEAALEMIPAARGRLRFEGAVIARPDPLGLIYAHIRVKAPQAVSVLPRRYPIPERVLPEGRRHQSGGVALTTSVGESEEFVSLRDYRPGDPLRRIHWRSWARTGRPVVKEYLDEFFVRHALVLDTFGRRRHDPVFEAAVSMAASFAAAGGPRDSLLDLLFVGDTAYCFTAGRGLAGTDRLLEVLSGVGPCRDTPFDALASLTLSRAATLSGCICVLIAWDEDRRAFVGRLRAMGLPVVVYLVTESGAAAPDPGPMADRPDRFRRLRPGRMAADLAAS
jgi:uncharacterized protein (DUF58 family)